jgi:hypothetical protein
MGNRYVQAPSHGGNYRAGQPTLIVIHSLEAPARRGLAYDLATGWLQNAGVSPHALTDPGETVETCSESLVGWHCGNGNQVGIGLEVTGYAAWSFEQWTSGDAFAAVRLDAKRAAEAARRHGIPIRWLSLSQIRNGERGFCTHADISATLGGTNHTDPGRGFPYAIFMQMVQQWTDGTIGNPTNPPNPQPGDGPGGAQPKDWFDMATQADLEAAVTKAIAAALPSIAQVVWSQIIKESKGGQPAWAVLMEARDKPAVPDKIGDVVWSQIIKEYENLPAWAVLVRGAEGGAPGDVPKA